MKNYLYPKQHQQLLSHYYNIFFGLVRPLFLVTIILFVWSTNALATDVPQHSTRTVSINSATTNLRIVVTIKPLYNLVMALLQGIDTHNQIRLLLQGNVSPHDYALKLSDTKILGQADLIVWGGEDLEIFLVKILKQQPMVNKLFTVQHLSGLHILPMRNSHHHLDEHLWLSPRNATVIIQELTKTLIKLDPLNKNKYLENKRNFLIKLSRVDGKIKAKLSTVKQQSYLVFHDAYQYFEKHYGLKAPLLISDDPAMPLSIQRMLIIHDLIIKKHVKCLFKEPQFNSKMLDSLVGSASKETLFVGELDPLGTEEDLGADGYFKLLNNLSKGLYSCFKK